MAKKKPVSIYQMRQRELAWMLYITEGYLANMQKALAVNCVTFEPRDEARVEKVIRQAEKCADELRQALNDIT